MAEELMNRQLGQEQLYAMMHPATSKCKKNVAFLQSNEDHTSFYCERLRQNMSSF